MKPISFFEVLAYLDARKAAGSEAFSIARRCMDIASRKNLSQVPRGNALELIIKKWKELLSIKGESKRDIAEALGYVERAYLSVQSGIDVCSDEWNGNALGNSKRIEKTWKTRYEETDNRVGVEALFYTSEANDTDPEKVRRSKGLKIDPMHQRYFMGDEADYREYDPDLDDPDDHWDISKNTRCF